MLRAVFFISRQITSNSSLTMISNLQHENAMLRLELRYLKRLLRAAHRIRAMKRAARFSRN
jgi:hypothetical protein